MIAAHLDVDGIAQRSESNNLALRADREAHFQQPLMLLLEDVHWADEMSLRLLSFLGRRLRTCSALLVGTAREEDLVHGRLGAEPVAGRHAVLGGAGAGPQREQLLERLPHLVRAAIKHNWPTPDSNKPGIVGGLLAPVYDPDADRMLLVRCARVLLVLDQLQYDIDHPEQARKRRRQR